MLGARGGGGLASRWMSGSNDQSRHILDLCGAGCNDKKLQNITVIPSIHYNGEQGCFCVSAQQHALAVALMSSILKF